MESKDKIHMRRALFLAAKAGKYVSPNPKVGTVLVKGGHVVGEGAHARYGGDHAEVVALRKAGSRAKGATLYVSLEPCAHHGKTPPCVEAILRAGISRVVIGMRDPNPLVAGRSIRLLRNSGVKVTVGLSEREAKSLNDSFLFSLTHGRPKVILKAAASLDGKIATSNGLSRWITGEKARRRAHRMRSEVDAILVGSRTALQDDPALTVRLPGFRREDGWPLRVLLDSSLELGPRAELFRGKARTLVFTSPRASVVREKILVKKGIWVFRVPQVKKMLSLGAVLRVLRALEVRSLLVEGGGEVHASFLREGFADEAALFLSPKILGGKGPSWVGGTGVGSLDHAPRLSDMRMERVGEDLLLTGKITGGRHLKAGI